MAITRVRGPGALPVRGVRLSNTWRLSRQLQTFALKDQQFRHLEVMLSLKSMGCSQTGEHTSPPPDAHIVRTSERSSTGGGLVREPRQLPHPLPLPLGLLVDALSPREALGCWRTPSPWPFHHLMHATPQPWTLPPELTPPSPTSRRRHRRRNRRCEALGAGSVRKRRLWKRRLWKRPLSRLKAAIDEDWRRSR